MSELSVLNQHTLQSKIYTIRGSQIMLDRDLAELYHVETRTLKQTVKRNINRFPDDFMFELTDKEMDFLVSQLVIPSKKHFGGSKPYAFTEQGVSMLSAVIKTPIAVDISIQIIKTFVSIRKHLLQNAALFQRIETIEQKQLQTDHKIDDILNAIENKSLQPKQGIFYDGQIFDAYTFISNLIRTAKHSIILLDNYIDESVFTHLSSKTNQNVKITILTKTLSQELSLDLKKHNAQYPKIEIKEFPYSHDRFLILDEKEIYHIGASLKDLGKKWFAFSLLDAGSFGLIDKIKEALK